MTEEWLEVVNEQDEVIDCRPHSEICRQQLRHQAHLRLFNAPGNVFLQKRSMSKDCFPGAWDSSVAGHVDPGEGYTDCILREAHEEPGLHLSTPPTLLFKLAAGSGTGYEFATVYRTQAEGSFLLNPAEIDEGRWFEHDILCQWLQDIPTDFTSGFRLIWQHLSQTA